MKLITLLLMLITAAPVVAQTRRYTEADLQPQALSTMRLNAMQQSEMRLTAAEEAARILEPYQFVAPERYRRTVIIGPRSPTAGPFGEFRPFAPARRLDGSRLSDPPWQSASFYRPFWPSPFGREVQRLQSPQFVVGSSPVRPTR